MAGKNRLKKEKRERKPLNLKPFLSRLGRVLGSVALVVAVGFAGFCAHRVISSTVFFSVKKINIRDNKRLSRDEVIAIAGVRPGDKMLKLDLQAIGSHLEKNPWVEHVMVKRAFPDALHIQVKEREPVAVVNLGYLCYVDGGGTLFKALNEGDALDYPVLTGFSEDDVSRDAAGTKAALKSAADLIAMLRTNPTFQVQDVSEIHFDKGFGFTLFTAEGGVPVRLGSDGFTEKLARFAKIYKDLQGQMYSLEYIDLNYTDKIVVKKA